MSKNRSDQKYEEIKAYYREKASVKEKELHMDLLAVRHEYVPHHLKRKFLTGLGIFGSVYLVEKLIFGKKIPRIIRFTTSLSAIVLAPKVYRVLEEKLLAIGELEPVEMEMLEDQQLSQDAETIPEDFAHEPTQPTDTDTDTDTEVTDPYLQSEEDDSISEIPPKPEEPYTAPPTDLDQDNEGKNDSKEK